LGRTIPNKGGVDTLLIVKLSKMPAVRFICVGGTAFVLDAVIVWGLTHLGLSAYVARVISLCVSITFTFMLNRLLTFSAKGPVTLTEVGAYIGASLIGIGINYGVYAALLKASLHWLPAMVTGTIMASLFNFFAYKRIFKKP
jgi:putative flippase GtrA